MIAVDTNVVIRVLLGDDERQSELAQRAWRDAMATGAIYFSKIVLAETAWVLRASYKFDRPAIADALARLVYLEGAVIEDGAAVRLALDAYADGVADFSDHLILETARAADALPLLTFDGAFESAEGVRLLR